jgi:SAM-dependent methyltransferase
MDIQSYNRDAWNRAVNEGNVWTVPVSPEMIAAARQGDWKIVLTPQKPVPRDWFPSEMHGVDVLCLASGGGQQGPILAATGAHVTVFDNSPMQLYQDRKVARREKLKMRAVEGDMRDLSIFPDASFDLVFHPVSNIFVPEILPVWREAYRVLRSGGVLLSGILNPLLYIFDRFKMDDEKELIVRYKLPYSDLTSPNPEEVERTMREGWPFEFSHSLEEQIGGQIQAGFAITGFYEDRDPYNPLDEYIPMYIATRAVKGTL